MATRHRRLNTVLTGTAVVLLASACGSSDTTATSAPPPTTAAPAPTTAAPAPTTAAPAPTTQPPPTTAASPTTEAPPATTAAPGLGSPAFAVPFVMEPPEGSRLRRSNSVDDGYVEFAAGTNEWLIFTTEGSNSVEGWASTLAETEGVTVSEATSREIGGKPADIVDVTFGARKTIISMPGVGFQAENGDSARLYVVDVDGEAVVIIAITSTDALDEWLVEVEATLATIRWGESP